MILYLDASALAKLYLTEHGQPEVEAAIAASSSLASAAITIVEVTATIARASKSGRLSDEEARAAHGALMRLWRRFFAVRCDSHLVQRAVAVAWEHGLRGYDAVHLACALTVQEDLREPVAVVTFDRELSRAARRAGLASIPEGL